MRSDMLNNGLLVYFTAIGIFIIGWVVLPLFLNNYWTSVLTETIIYGIFAAGLFILNNQIGLPSLGQAAFFGTGGYVLAISLVHLELGQVTSLLFAVGAILVVAMVTGLFVLYARGVYFLFLTLAVSQILWAIVWKWYSVTGGDNGLGGFTRPSLGLSWWDLSSVTGFHYFILVIFILAFLALRLITTSSLGLSFVGIRESELRMKSLGYNVWFHNYLGYIISGFFSGLAGILFAWQNLFMAPEQFGLPLSASGLFMCILGGGSLGGTLAGAIIIVLVKHISSMLTSHWLLIMGAFYIIVIIFMPQGISGILQRVRRG